MNGAFHGIEMKRVISQFKLFHIHSMLSQFNLRCIDCNCVTTTTELRWPHRSLPFTVEELLGNTSKQLFLSIGNILKCETFQAELCFSEALVWSRVLYHLCGDVDQAMAQGGMLLTVCRCSPLDTGVFNSCVP